MIEFGEFIDGIYINRDTLGKGGDGMYIPQRNLLRLEEAIQPGRAVVIYGPRRSGKTTLLRHFLEKKRDYLFVTGEDKNVDEYLTSQSIEKLKSFVGRSSLLVIDEAQKIANIGLNLKLLVDHVPSLAIIATGSSSFDLLHHMGEPLTGRKKTLLQLPLSQMELQECESRVETRAHLESRLVFGSYPEVVLLPSDREKKEYLQELINDYLCKDILELEGLKRSKKIFSLLRLIAFQIGKEVSYSELASQLGLSKETVEKYLDLLEQVFVIMNVRGFSRNLRSEVTKMSRYYFYDNGVRNGLINNFNLLSLRNDIGELWENYLAMERRKKQTLVPILSQNYFWRTYEQKEIDWVEERDGQLFGYEFKWKDGTIKAPALWRKAYPQSSFEVIHPENYLDFIA